MYRGLRRAYRVVAIESTKRAVSGEGWRVSGKGHSTYGPNPGAKRSLRRTNSTPLLISDNSRNTPPSLSIVSRSLRLSTFNFGIYLSIFAPLSLSLSLSFLEIRSRRETWILRGCYEHRRSEKRRGICGRRRNQTDRTLSFRNDASFARMEKQEGRVEGREEVVEIKRNREKEEERDQGKVCSPCISAMVPTSLH